MIQEGTKQYIPLSEFITEYSERNTENKYSPVAVGKYGIRSRESIYSKELASDYSKNKLIYKNTLTVGMGSKQIDVGVLIDDITYSVSPAYHTYKVTKINAKYLDYCIQCRNQDMFTRFVKRGSRQGKTVDLKRWLTYEIPVYDEKSQVEIVDHLNRVQSLIELRQKQLEKLDELIKARFVEMFDLSKCAYKSLGECTDFVDYRGHTPELSEEGTIRMINAKSVGKGFFKYVDEFITEKTYESWMHRGFGCPGDILFVTEGHTFGNTCLIPGDMTKFALGQRVITIKGKEEIKNAFLCSYMQTDMFWKDINVYRTGGTAQGIRSKDLVKVTIPIPPIEQQKDFVKFVHQVDKSKVIDTNIIPEGGFYYGDKFFIS